MSDTTNATAAALEREQWAAMTEPARRVSRANAVMRRAHRDVETEPRLTDDELTKTAQIYLDARQAAS